MESCRLDFYIFGLRSTTSVKGMMTVAERRYIVLTSLYQVNTRPWYLMSWVTKLPRIRTRSFLSNVASLIPGVSTKIFENISHLEVDITPYLSNFSKEVAN